MKSLTHEQEIAYIKKKIFGKRPCFSWIFFGSKGIGKALAAKNLSLELLQSHLDGHPDLKIVEPLDTKDGISTEQIREIKSFLSLKSAISPYKIVIIDSIDEVSYQGSNALLKILEEPTDNTFIFLISHNISKVLPTIRSRSVEVNFRDLTTSECINVLQKSYGFREDFEESIILSANNPGIAIEYMENNVVDHYRKMLSNIGSPISITELKAYEGNIKHLQLLLMRFISILNKAILGIDVPLINIERETINKVISMHNAHKIMDLWQKTLENYKNQDIYNLDIKTNLYLTLAELG